jgi:hypothetical protein
VQIFFFEMMQPEPLHQNDAYGFYLLTSGFKMSISLFHSLEVFHDHFFNQQYCSLLKL